MRIVAEQYEVVDEGRSTLPTSSSTVTEQAEPPRVPSPHLGPHAVPSSRQFLHSPGRLSAEGPRASCPVPACSPVSPSASHRSLPPAPGD